MSYVAYYRKFRPADFREIKGQDAVVRSLQNQVVSGRIGHAYVFSGMRGTGKTSAAKVFAKAVNCLAPEDGNPCGKCEMCRRIAAGNSLNVIEFDAASNNGVDHIRDIVEDVNYRPAEGRYRVYIIDEAHMITTAAFNALLKTLEEPPSYVIFILATTEPSQIPLTILSRCQHYEFRRIGTDVIADRLAELAAKESLRIDGRAVRYIAKCAEGSMRDALSLLDQCASFAGGDEVTYDGVLRVLGTVDSALFSELLSAIYEGNAAECIRIFDGTLQKGKDPRQFVADFTWFLRNMMIIKAAGKNAEPLVDLTSEQLRSMRELCGEIATESLMRYIRVLSELPAAMRYQTNRRILIEIALLRLCRPQMEQGDGAIADRLRIAELRLSELRDQIRTLQVRYSSGMPSQPGDTDVFESVSASPFADMPETEKAEQAAAEGSAAPQASSGVRPGNAEQPVPAGAPERLQDICLHWPEITAALSGRIARQMLSEVVPSYDPEDPDGILYVNLDNPLAERIPKDEGLKAELSGIFRARYRADVPFVIQMARDSGKNLSAIRIDDILKERIHIRIDEE